MNPYNKAKHIVDKHTSSLIMTDEWSHELINDVAEALKEASTNMGIDINDLSKKELIACLNYTKDDIDTETDKEGIHNTPKIFCTVEMVNGALSLKTPSGELIPRVKYIEIQQSHDMICNNKGYADVLIQLAAIVK